MAFVMFGLVEAVFYSLNGRRAISHRIEQQHFGDLHHFDPVLGFRAAPETTVGEVMSCNGERVFEATYRFDPAGRRVVPDADDFDTTEPCVMFFGGSFVFGVGCDDEDTLPGHFARATTGVAVYNYGFPGYGPGQMLAQLESGDVAEQVGTGRDAIGVYVFIAGHVSRAAGSMRVSTTWGRHFPCYKRMEDGRYALLGSFQSARPVRMWLYDLLAREQVLKYFEADVPPWLTARDLEFTAGMVAAARDAFERQFANGRFFALVYPEHPAGPRAYTILPYLEKAGVQCLDYSGLVDLNQKGYLIPVDLHPTGKAHAAVASQLASDLSFRESAQQQ